MSGKAMTVTKENKINQEICLAEEKTLKME